MVVSSDGIKWEKPNTYVHIDYLINGLARSPVWNGKIWMLNTVNDTDEETPVIATSTDGMNWNLTRTVKLSPETDEHNINRISGIALRRLPLYVKNKVIGGRRGGRRSNRRRTTRRKTNRRVSKPRK